MTDAFYIIKVKGARAAAGADSFHQVERMVDKTGAFWAMIVERTKEALIFGCAILFIGI